VTAAAAIGVFVATGVGLGGAFYALVRATDALAGGFKRAAVALSDTCDGDYDDRLDTNQ